MIEYIFACAFNIGMITSIARVLRKQMFSARFFTVIFVVLLVGLFMLREYLMTGGRGGIPVMIFVLGIIFGVLVVVTFLRLFLPAVNESIIMVNTILFWYLQSMEPFVPTYLLIIPVIATITVFAISLSQWKPAMLIRGLVYVWNLTILVCIMVLYLFSIGWGMPDGQVAYIAGLQGFFVGMLFITLAGSLIPIIMLIPSKHNRLRSIKATMQGYVEKFADEQMPIRSFLLIVFLSGVVLGGNAMFGFLPHLLLVNIVSSLLSSAMRTDESIVYGNADAAGTRIVH